MNAFLIRFFDLLLASFGLIVLSPIMLLVYLFGLFDTGSPLFFQSRVGRFQQPFVLIKFRTMKKETHSVATHLADARSVTTFGAFLRKTKLDELPQLWNVLKGEMSLVGPRPCLFNQAELIQERARRNVFEVRPGITGLAQIQGIDMSNPHFLATVDEKMIQSFKIIHYFQYIFQTAIGKGAGDRIKR